MCVVAGLDGHCHVSLHVYTLDIIKNMIKQLVAIVVLVGTSPLSSWTATINVACTGVMNP